MPRATVIQNPTAGHGALTPERLLGLVRRHGWTPDYATTDDDLDAALQDPGDLVVAAGGDGTVGRVAARLLGKAAALAILPLGTANNVANGLGIRGDPESLAAGWAGSTERRLDVGRVRGPWGTLHFVESFGMGLFADAIPILAALKKEPGAADTPGDALRHDRRLLATLLPHVRARTYELSLDGDRVADAHVMIDVMNVPSLGPGLRIAPQADPFDGQLDVVFVPERERFAFGQWLRREDVLAERGAGDSTTLPVRTRRARSVDLLWRGDVVHIDGHVWGGERTTFTRARTASAGAGAEVRIGLEPGGVTVLLPGAR